MWVFLARHNPYPLPDNICFNCRLRTFRRVRQISKMCKDIPKKYNSDDIRKAVLPLVVEYKKHPLLGGGDVILDSDIPKEIKSLPLFSDAHWFDTCWAGTNEEGLMFLTGGGDTHWGIIVYQN